MTLTASYLIDYKFNLDRRRFFGSDSVFVFDSISLIEEDASDTVVVVELASN